MHGSRWSAIALMACIPCLVGCLITRHRTREIRESETRQEVIYESELAREMFQDRANSNTDRVASGSTSAFAIPFLLWWSKTEVRSPGAYFNDLAATCDHNGDGLISEAEARDFNPQFGRNVEHMAEVEVEAEHDERVKPASATRSKPTRSKQISKKSTRHE